MAQIVTPNTRPQFATVRYKVMNAPVRKEEAAGEILIRKLPKDVKESKASCVSVTPIPPRQSISDAEILVVGGRALQKEADLDMIKALASLLGRDPSFGGKGLDDQRPPDRSVRSYRASPPDHYLRCERRDSVHRLYERRRPHRVHQHR